MNTEIIDEVQKAKVLEDGTQISGIASQFKRDARVAKLDFELKIVQRLACSLLSKRFLIATGLAGSGKTKLAQAFARWLTPSHLVADVFAPGSEIHSSNINYYVKNSDNISVEFWNSQNEADSIKVTLPREMISEWAAYI